MTFTIDPAMNFNEVIAYYEEYLKDTREKGEVPVTFMRFITGRF